MFCFALWIPVLKADDGRASASSELSPSEQGICSHASRVGLYYGDWHQGLFRLSECVCDYVASDMPITSAALPPAIVIISVEPLQPLSERFQVLTTGLDIHIHMAPPPRTLLFSLQPI